MAKRPSRQSEQAGFFPMPNNTTGADTQSELPDIAFFLGAGASADAGIPTTVQFVQSFLDSRKNSEQKKAVQQLLDKLKEWAGRQSPPRDVDIELLLETLQRLADRERDPLSAFLDKDQLSLPDLKPSELLKAVRDFVKDQVIVEPEAVRYLDPLRGFISQYRPLPIYSANYDTCVELFCSEHRLKYRDGFDEAWNPKVFDDDPDIDLRLYKIHGSVTWYRSDRGRYLKIPIRTSEDSLELITKEWAVSLMLYPAQKFDYVEPLFELLVRMKEGLAACKTLFVIGYSFRDDHVRNLLWDIARQRKDFYVVLIDPLARQIYEHRLKTHDGTTLSLLAEKVLCLPFRFGLVLPHLLNDLLPEISASRRLIQGCREFEATGQVHFARWEDCLAPTARAGDYRSVRMMLEKIDVRRKARLDHLFEGITLGMIYSLGNRDDEPASFFWTQFGEQFESFIQDLRIAVNGSERSKWLNANTSNNSNNFSNILNDLRRIREMVASRTDWMMPGNNAKKFVSAFSEYLQLLEVWSKVNVSFSEYLNARGSNCSKALQSALQKVNTVAGTMYDSVELGVTIEQEIKSIEITLLKHVLEKYSDSFQVS